MRCLCSSLLLMGLLQLHTASAWAVKIGEWDVHSYPSDGPKKGCIMTGTYVDKTRLSIMVNKQYSWGVGFYNPEWKLAPSGSTPATLVIDGTTVTSSTAQHLGPDIAYLPLTGSGSYAALQKGYSLDVVTPKGKLNFLLTGTSRAMAATLECVEALNGRLPATSQAANTTSSQNMQELTQAEAAVMLANLLNAAGVNGYKLEQPTAGSSGASFVLSDGTRGALVAARGNTKSADDYSNFLIGILSKSCKGDFISGRQNIATTDGSVARKVVTTCKADNTLRVTESTVIRRPSGFLMNLSQTLPANIESLDAGTTGKERKSLTDAVMRISDQK